MSKKSILLIEDEKEIRDIVHQGLQSKLDEIRISESPNAMDAFLKLELQQFDLVVLDMGLPGKSGYEVLRFLGDMAKAKKPKNLLILTGSASEAEIRARTEESFHFMAKPCRSSEVAAKICSLIGEPLAAAPPPKAAPMDITILNAFIDATLKVLSTMAGTECKKQKIFVRGSDQISGDVSALVAINGKLQTGSMAISFEEKCFLGVMSRMLGEEVTQLTPDVVDGAGELCNQIFGITKKNLNEQGMDIQPAIPSVITGAGHRIKHMSQGPILAVRFDTASGPFVIEAILQKTAATAASA